MDYSSITNARGTYIFKGVLIPEKKVNFLNVSNESCLKEEELKKYTNEDCCILFSALTHASTLIVISNKYYLFDTLEHHQKMMFNRSGRSVHVGNPEIFQNLSASINVINPFVSRIQDTDSLQGPSNSCAIWTICAYLELSKFKNLSNALVLTPTNLDCQAVFTETVFKNIGKMVSYLSDYQKDSKVHEFDNFILAEANAEINYKIPEKPMFINKTVFEKLLDMSKNIEEQSKKLKPKVMIANDVSALSSTKTQQELIQTSLREQETQLFQCPESPENTSTQQPENEAVPGLSALIDQLPQGFIDSVKKQQSKLRDKQKTIQGNLEL